MIRYIEHFSDFVRIRNHKLPIMVQPSTLPRGPEENKNTDNCIELRYLKTVFDVACTVYSSEIRNLKFELMICQSRPSETIITSMKL
jgi:hypothetical protein